MIVLCFQTVAACLCRDEARRPSCWKLYWRNVILCFNSFVTFFFKLIHPTVRILLCFHDSAKPFYNSSLPSTFNESREIKKTKNKNICKRKTHNRCFRTTLDVESRLWEHSFILGYTLIIDQCVTFPHRQMPSCKGNKGKTVSRQADSRSGWLMSWGEGEYKQSKKILSPRVKLCMQISISSPLWCHKRLFPSPLWDPTRQVGDPTRCHL